MLSTITVQAGAQLRVRRDRVKVEAIEERSDVQPRATDDDGEPAPRRDVREHRARVALVAGDVVALTGIDHVDEVVRDASALIV